jgi:hypothetical protein
MHMYGIGDSSEPVEKLQIWFKSDNNIGHFTRESDYVLLLRHKSIFVQRTVLLFCKLTCS